jgi:hypothetical protein
MYEVGTKLVCNEVNGTVVENVKLPGDICVMWEGYTSIVSYDIDWLDENAKVVE